jgi:hypothetical protein
MFTRSVRTPVVVTGALVVALYSAGCPRQPGQPGQPTQPENPEVTRALHDGFNRGVQLAQANPSSANGGVCESQNWDFDILSMGGDPAILAEIPAVRYAGCRVGHASYVMGWTIKARGHRTSRYCTTYAREKIDPIVRSYADRGLTPDETNMVINACRQGYNDGHRSAGDGSGEGTDE